ncbi:MAG: FGGY family carbohydrate kinase, partial [Spirochaetia bacterium]|nr:FGGY family carbohydrate kinase [Spirochaetia bacterium]
MILTIDIGTTSAKAALFTSDGACLALERSSIQGRIGNSPLEQEIDPEQWSRALIELIAALSKGRSSVLGDLRCIAVSGNGPTLFPVDGEGKPLHKALTWMDRRAFEESRELEATLGRKLDPAYNLPKALWFKKNREEIYQKTRHFMSPPEYLCALLTGQWVSFLPAPGYESIIWDDASLDALGLDKAKFPPFVRLGTVVGGVSGRAAETMGLPAGTPVVAGGPDFIVSLLGTATTKPRRACNRSGTSEGINLCWEKGLERHKGLLYMPHVVEPYENISGVISSSGRALTWYMDSQNGSPIDQGEFFALAAMAPAGAGSLIFLPYLTGERAPIWNPKARACFIGLSLRHGRAEMARAVVESIGFAMRDVIDVMESTGAQVDELRVTGQPSGNSMLNQIKADITKVPIRVPEFREAELLGDLCVALTALGQFPDLATAAENLVGFSECYEPDPSKMALYDELFALYRNSYQSLEDEIGRA